VKAIYLIIGLILPVPFNLINNALSAHEARYYTGLVFHIIIAFLIFFLIGAYIGFYGFLNNLYKKGNWSFKKFNLIIAIIFVIISALPYTVFVCQYFGYELFLLRDVFFTWVIIAGYLVVSAFEKKEKPVGLPEETTTDSSPVFINI